MIEDFENLLKHTSIYALGNILSKIVGFIMIPIYTRHLSPADYGVLELLTLISTVLSMLFSLRIADGIVRYYHEYDNFKDKNRLVSTVQIVVTAIAILTTYFFSQERELVSRLVFRNTEYSSYFIFIFICFAFDICTSVSYTYLRVLEKSLHYIAASLLQLLLGLGLNIYFIVFLNWGVRGILYSMVISNGIVCLLLVGYTFGKVKFNFDLAKLKKLAAFGTPLIPAGILMFILNMGDRFLLNRLTNLSEVGIYALGYKFGTLLGTFIGSPFSSIWLPKKVEIYNNRSDRNEIFARVLVYFIFILSITGLAISTLIKELFQVIATPEFLLAYRIVPWVIMGYGFYMVYSMVDIGIYMTNQTFWYPIINAIAAGVNVVLNLLIIPKFGAMGAAIVTAVSFFVCPLMAFMVSQRLYYIHYDFIRIMKLLITVLVFYFLGSLVSTQYLLLNISIKTAVILTYPMFLYLINFFDSKEIVFIKNRIMARFGYSIS